MFLSVSLLVTLASVLLAFILGFLYACRLAHRHTQYNKRLFVQVLEEKAANERLAAQVLRLQGRKPERQVNKSQFHS